MKQSLFIGPDLEFERFEGEWTPGHAVGIIIDNANGGVREFQFFGQDALRGHGHTHHMDVGLMEKNFRPGFKPGTYGLPIDPLGDRHGKFGRLPSLEDGFPPLGMESRRLVSPEIIEIGDAQLGRKKIIRNDEHTRRDRPA